MIAPEVEFGSALTASTLLTLRRRCPRHSFIWLMGADNMAFFGSWQRHHVIARRMPIAVIDRPGYSYRAMNMGVRLLDRRVTVGRMAAKLGVPEAWDGIGASSLGAGTMRRQQPFGRQAGRAQMWRETISRLQSIPDPDQILELVTSSLDDDKAEDIVAIPLGGKSSMADFMVIASGRSSRQVASMAEHLEFRLKQAGVEVLGLEGMRQADWVLIDANDVIVHLFRPEVREFYGLERMWANDGPQEVVTVSN